MCITTEDFRLVCRKCNMSIHYYTCECSDYIIKLNICKHIHACTILSSSNTQSNLCETKEKEMSSNRYWVKPIVELNVMLKLLAVLLVKNSSLLIFPLITLFSHSSNYCNMSFKTSNI